MSVREGYWNVTIKHNSADNPNIDGVITYQSSSINVTVTNEDSEYSSNWRTEPGQPINTNDISASFNETYLNGKNYYVDSTIWTVNALESSIVNVNVDIIWAQDNNMNWSIKAKHNCVGKTFNLIGRANTTFIDDNGDNYTNGNIFDDFITSSGFITSGVSIKYENDPSSYFNFTASKIDASDDTEYVFNYLISSQLFSFTNKNVSIAMHVNQQPSGVWIADSSSPTCTNGTLVINDWNALGDIGLRIGDDETTEIQVGVGSELNTTLFTSSYVSNPYYYNTDLNFLDTLVIIPDVITFDSTKLIIDPRVTFYKYYSNVVNINLSLTQTSTGAWNYSISHDMPNPYISSVSDNVLINFCYNDTWLCFDSTSGHKSKVTRTSASGSTGWTTSLGVDVFSSLYYNTILNNTTIKTAISEDTPSSPGPQRFDGTRNSLVVTVNTIYHINVITTLFNLETYTVNRDLNILLYNFRPTNGPDYKSPMTVFKTRSSYTVWGKNIGGISFEFASFNNSLITSENNSNITITYNSTNVNEPIGTLNDLLYDGEYSIDLYDSNYLVENNTNSGYYDLYITPQGNGDFLSNSFLIGENIIPYLSYTLNSVDPYIIYNGNKKIVFHTTGVSFTLIQPNITNVVLNVTFTQQIGGEYKCLITTTPSTSQSWPIKITYNGTTITKNVNGAESLTGFTTTEGVSIPKSSLTFSKNGLYDSNPVYMYYYYTDINYTCTVCGITKSVDLVSSSIEYEYDGEICDTSNPVPASGGHAYPYYINVQYRTRLTNSADPTHPVISSLYTKTLYYSDNEFSLRWSVDEDITVPSKEDNIDSGNNPTLYEPTAGSGRTDYTQAIFYVDVDGESVEVQTPNMNYYIYQEANHCTETSNSSTSTNEVTVSSYANYDRQNEITVDAYITPDSGSFTASGSPSSTNVTAYEKYTYQWRQKGTFRTDTITTTTTNYTYTSGYTWNKTSTSTSQGSNQTRYRTLSTRYTSTWTEYRSAISQKSLTPSSSSLSFTSGPAAKVSSSNLRDNIIGEATLVLEYSVFSGTKPTATFTQEANSCSTTDTSTTSSWSYTSSSLYIEPDSMDITPGSSGNFYVSATYDWNVRRTVTPGTKYTYTSTYSWTKTGTSTTQYNSGSTNLDNSVTTSHSGSTNYLSSSKTGGRYKVTYSDCTSSSVEINEIITASISYGGKSDSANYELSYMPSLETWSTTTITRYINEEYTVESFNDSSSAATEVPASGGSLHLTGIYTYTKNTYTWAYRDSEGVNDGSGYIVSGTNNSVNNTTTVTLTNSNSSAVNRTTGSVPTSLKVQYSAGVFTGQDLGYTVVQQQSMLVSSNYTGLSGTSLSDSVMLTQEANKIERTVLNGASYSVGWAFSTSSSKTIEYTSWSSAPSVDFSGIGTGVTKYTYNNYYTSGAGPEISSKNVQDFTDWYLSTATENYSALNHSLSPGNDTGSTKEYDITVYPVGSTAPSNSTFTFFTYIFKNSGGSRLGTIQYSVTTRTSTPATPNFSVNAQILPNTSTLNNYVYITIDLRNNNTSGTEYRTFEFIKSNSIQGTQTNPEEGNWYFEYNNQSITRRGGDTLLVDAYLHQISTGQYSITIYAGEGYCYKRILDY